LDSVAPKVAGQMAIGTIDCTVEKKLCDEHDVRGYPTLKFSLDGATYGYEGGRTERDLLAFAAKMLRPVVELVTSVDAAMTFAAEQSDNGVAFLAFHPALAAPNGPDTPAEDKLQSTPVTQVFAQAARQQRAVATFILLDSTNSKDDESAAAMAANLGQDGPFICRLEENVPPRCYDSSQFERMTLSKLLSWIETQNVAIVSALGPNNFHRIGRRGRPLVIAVVSEQSPEQMEAAKRELALFATTGPEAIRDKYYYGWFDGNAWKKFLSQFDVVPTEMPQVFALNVPRKKYWQNATYKLNVGDFLQAIEDGTVEAKTSTPKGIEGRLNQFYMLMNSWLPWSAVALGVLFLGLVGAITWCITPGEELRPPYPRVPPKTSSMAASQSAPTTNVPTVEVPTKEEAKKDK
jgi:Thioredoxin-like domain/Thioredoxin